jgi:hypothetical protein
MRMNGKRVLGLGLITVFAVGYARAQSVTPSATPATPAIDRIVIDRSGRTVSAPTELHEGADTLLLIPGGGNTNPGDPATAQYQVRYRADNTLPAQADILTDKDRSAVAEGEVFSIPGSTKASPVPPFITYNVWRIVRLTALKQQDIDAAEADRKAKADALAAAKMSPDYQEYLRQTKPEDVPPTAEEELDAQLKARIAVLEKEETAYSTMGTDAAVDPLTKVESELRTRRQELADLELKIAAKRRADKEKMKAAAKDVETKTAELQAAEAKLGPREFAVVKTGILIRGSHRRVAYFAFPPFEEGDNIRLQLMGDLPVLSEADALYVCLVNHQPGRHPKTFTLTVKSDKGSTIDEANIRPPAGSHESGNDPNAVPPKIERADPSYDDVVLPIGKRFAGNDIPKLTLVTTANVVSDNKTTTTDGKAVSTKTVQQQDVTLLNEFVLPQVHPLYRFNMATGIVYGSLRDREFSKVQTQLDDPATTTVNEARYRIDSRRAGKEIRPVLGITWYWQPIDPLLPQSAADRWTPQPTLAFGSTSPTKNVYIGFTNEITRSVQIFWGYNRSTRTELQVRSDVDEDRQSALPPTRTRPTGGPFIGVTLNIKNIGKLFGLTN